MKNMISSKLLCTDVLAIRCIDEFIFVGIGHVLHIFDRRTSKLEKKINALCPHNIHGIVKEPNNKVLVYGGNAVRVYHLIRTASRKIELEQLYSTDRLSDWVIAAKWLPGDDFFNLVVLCGHNDVEIYGGCISLKENKDIVVFSGTVFQEILIWEIRRELPVRENAAAAAAVLHRLTGHNGVIFSIVYAPSARLICSTSDDRTVRLWEVTTPETKGEKKEPSEVDWKTARVKLIRTMYGHTGRVWRSVVREKMIISVGEDSLICTWSLTGKLLGKITGHHRGAAIWSMDVSEEEGVLFTGGADGEVRALPLEKEQVRATISLPISADGTRASPKYISYLSSGALMVYREDGRISCYYGRAVCQADRLGRSFTLPKGGRYCAMRTSPCRRYVAFASNDGYVEVYEEGRSSKAVLLERLFEEKAMETRILSLHWLGNDRILACGAEGILKLYRFTIRGIKLRSVCLLPQSRERWLTAAAVSKEERLLVCADRAGSVHVYNLPVPIPHGGFAGALGSREQFEEPQIYPGPIRFASIVRPVQTLYKVHGRIGVQAFMVLEDGNRLMSAGRDGTVKFYEFGGVESESAGGGSVTGGPLRMLHTEKMPMDWIGDTVKTADDILVLGFKEVEFIIYGMSGRRVLARIACGGGHRSWDCAVRPTDDTVLAFAYIRNKQVFACECELLPSSGQPAVVSNGFHAKETYCLEALGQVDGRAVLLSAGEDTSLRVTCVSRAFPEGTYSFRTLAILDGHVSSVKCLKSIELRRPAAGLSREIRRLVFSAGARAQMKVWEIAISERIGETEVTSKDVSCIDLTCHMLHGLDRRNRRKSSAWQGQRGQEEEEEAEEVGSKTLTITRYETQPEARYMDIDVLWPNGSVSRAFIFVGCADGRLRTFVYHAEEEVLRLKATIRHVDRCILKTSVLPGTTADRTILLTMSTDGTVRFYDLTKIVAEILNEKKNEMLVERSGETAGVTVLAEFRLHQSGINAFDLKQFGKGGEYILATGGDDNLFSLASFRVEEAAATAAVDVKLLSTWKIASAHTAQITGIRFKAGEKKVFSVGVDQRVVIYEYECSESKIVSVKVLDQTYTAVPDVQGMVFLLPPLERRRRRRGRENCSLACVVYGKGFELFTVE